MGKWIRTYTCAVSLVLVLHAPNSVWAQVPPREDLEKAVATLRHINPEDVKKLSYEEQEEWSKRIDSAWKTISSAGKDGMARLKQEIKKVTEAKEKDDFFKLNASAVLWNMAGLEEVNAITEIWNSTPLKVHYPYVFYTALEAARKQDPKALPLLKACLRDKEGSVFVPEHSLDVGWPLNQEFIWGAYGPGGLPVLAKVLEESKDPVELQSAMLLLRAAQYLDALPAMRKLAKEGNEDVRRMAIQSLGFFGHPKDYDFLISGLKSKDPKDACAFVFAFYDFGDLRAVPLMVPLLDSSDDALRHEVILTLMQLLAPASLEAIRKCSQTEKNGEQKEQCEKIMDGILRKLNLDWEKFSGKPQKEKEELMRGLRDDFEKQYELKKDDRAFTHDELVEAANDWIERNRITGGKYEWVESRHVLAAATPQDIDLFLKVKASVYLRLSDECLYEIRELNNLIMRLGRSRYRKVVDVAEKVEEKK